MRTGVARTAGAPAETGAAADLAAGPEIGDPQEITTGIETEIEIGTGGMVAL